MVSPDTFDAPLMLLRENALELLRQMHTAQHVAHPEWDAVNALIYHGLVFACGPASRKCYALTAQGAKCAALLCS